ncbi:unnamed protein product [Amoebophrya sp. A120]|nr:unnamed protein product [Amoebophrya sp. A120]|eukprot:GSA120T00000452001.1
MASTGNNSFRATAQFAGTTEALTSRRTLSQHAASTMQSKIRYSAGTSKASSSSGGRSSIEDVCLAPNQFSCTAHCCIGCCTACYVILALLVTALLFVSSDIFSEVFSFSDLVKLSRRNIDDDNPSTSLSRTTYLMYYMTNTVYQHRPGWIVAMCELICLAVVLWVVHCRTRNLSFTEAVEQTKQAILEEEEDRGLVSAAAAGPGASGNYNAAQSSLERRALLADEGQQPGGDTTTTMLQLAGNRDSDQLAKRFARQLTARVRDGAGDFALSTKHVVNASLSTNATTTPTHLRDDATTTVSAEERKMLQQEESSLQFSSILLSGGGGGPQAARTSEQQSEHFLVRQYKSAQFATVIWIRVAVALLGASFFTHLGLGLLYQAAQTTMELNPSSGYVTDVGVKYQIPFFVPALMCVYILTVLNPYALGLRESAFVCCECCRRRSGRAAKLKVDNIDSEGSTIGLAGASVVGAPVLGPTQEDELQEMNAEDATLMREAIDLELGSQEILLRARNSVATTSSRASAATASSGGRPAVPFAQFTATAPGGGGLAAGSQYPSEARGDPLKGDYTSDMDEIEEQFCCDNCCCLCMKEIIFSGSCTSIYLVSIFLFFTCAVVPMLLSLILEDHDDQNKIQMVTVDLNRTHCPISQYLPGPDLTGVNIPLYNATGEEVPERFLNTSSSFIPLNQTDMERVGYVNVPQDGSLTPILWMFWDKGIAGAPCSVRRGYLAWVRALQNSWHPSGRKWTIVFLSTSNYKRYVSQRVMESVGIYLSPPRFSDLVRLTVLHRFGGAYIDATSFPTENLDWLNARFQPWQKGALPGTPHVPAESPGDGKYQSPVDVNAQVFAFNIPQMEDGVTNLPMLESWFIASPVAAEFTCLWKQEFQEVGILGTKAQLRKLWSPKGPLGGRGTIQNMNEPRYFSIHVAHQFLMQKYRYLNEPIAPKGFQPAQGPVVPIDDAPALRMSDRFFVQWDSAYNGPFWIHEKFNALGKPNEASNIFFRQQPGPEGMPRYFIKLAGGGGGAGTDVPDMIEGSYAQLSLYPTGYPGAEHVREECQVKPKDRSDYWTQQIQQEHIKMTGMPFPEL